MIVRGEDLDSTSFILSLFSASLGVFTDLYSTHVFIKDLGINYEANPLMKKIISRGGLKRTLLVQIPIIVVLALVDSQSSFLLFWGLWFGIARGLIGLRNFQMINRYRIVGVDRFKEQDANIRRLLVESSTRQKIQTMLLPAVFLILCLSAILFIEDMIANTIIFALASFYSAEIWYGRPKTIKKNNATPSVS